MARVVSVLVLVALATACAFDACRVVEFDPIAVAQAGPLLPDPAGGPPVECRDLSRERCEVGFGALDGGGGGEPLVDGEIQRLVVSCVGVCGPAGGEFRIDAILVGGRTELLANGGYGDFEQRCV